MVSSSRAAENSSSSTRRGTNRDIQAASTRSHTDVHSSSCRACSASCLCSRARRWRTGHVVTACRMACGAIFALRKRSIATLPVRCGWEARTMRQAISGQPSPRIGASGTAPAMSPKTPLTSDGTSSADSKNLACPPSLAHTPSDKPGSPPRVTCRQYDAGASAPARNRLRLWPRHSPPILPRWEALLFNPEFVAAFCDHGLHGTCSTDGVGLRPMFSTQGVKVISGQQYSHLTSQERA